MRCYLVRHGRAVPAGLSLPDDARWLTGAGRAEAAALGAALRERGVRLDAIVTSPLVRAVQTAELIARGLGLDAPIEALPLLTPEGVPSRVPDELAARGVDVLAVGHEPTISALAGLLVGRRMAAFRTAELVCVDHGALGWRVAPG